MKRRFAILLLLVLPLVLAACTSAPAEPVEEPPAPPVVVEPPAPKEPFPGKIAIITTAVDSNSSEYRCAQQEVDKYGKDKILYVTWPANFIQEQEHMITIVSRIAADTEITALIISHSVPGTNAAVAKLRETRNDIFVVYCQPQEDPEGVAQLSDMVLDMDAVAVAPAMAQQAYKMGAKTFVYYSFPRHMADPTWSSHRDLVKEKCTELGIEFITVEAPDPNSKVGVAGAMQFILEDVPKIVAKYGLDTAFFCTNCSLQIPLIKRVTDEGAIYPQPCCPSPYNGFTAALGIKTSENGLDDIDYTISETTRILKEKNMLGRVSNWPAPVSYWETNAGVEYAIKWLNGEVQQEGIDVDVLKQCMEDYAGVECFIRPYADENGVEYENYLLVREDYLTYGEEHIN